MYICPVCQQPLSESNQVPSKTLRCELGHSFDRHKKGYVNLLLAQHKRSKQPGDDSEMVAGRRAFLEAGFYQPLAAAITKLVSLTNAKTILDAGCGEGYYLNQLSESISDLSIAGFDISKVAIHSASRYKQGEWAVASSARMPYADNSVDLILSVFSRIEAEEFKRVLKPEGYVVFAGPGPNHLLALRELIYTDVRDYEAEKHHGYFDNQFSLVKQLGLEVPLALTNNEQILQLLSMTPHSQRVNQEAEARLAQRTSLNDVADFRLYLYQSSHSS